MFEKAESRILNECAIWEAVGAGLYTDFAKFAKAKQRARRLLGGSRANNPLRKALLALHRAWSVDSLDNSALGRAIERIAQKSIRSVVALEYKAGQYVSRVSDEDRDGLALIGLQLEELEVLDVLHEDAKVSDWLSEQIGLAAVHLRTCESLVKLDPASSNGQWQLARDMGIIAGLFNEGLSKVAARYEPVEVPDGERRACISLLTFWTNRVFEAFWLGIGFAVMHEGIDPKHISSGIKQWAERKVVPSRVRDASMVKYLPHFSGVATDMAYAANALRVCSGLQQERKILAELSRLRFPVDDAAETSYWSAPFGLVVLASVTPDRDVEFTASHGLFDYTVTGKVAPSKISRQHFTMLPYSLREAKLSGVALPSSVCFSKADADEWTWSPMLGNLLKREPDTIVGKSQQRLQYTASQVLESRIREYRSEIGKLWEAYPAFFNELPDVGPLLFVRDENGALAVGLLAGEKLEVMQDGYLSEFDRLGGMDVYNEYFVTESAGWQFFELRESNLEEETDQMVADEERPAQRHDRSVLRNALFQHCNTMHDVLRLLENNFDVQHDLSQGAGSHSVLHLNGKTETLSRKIRESTELPYHNVVRRILLRLGIAEEDFIAALSC